jgi:hypothetical protein
MEEIRNRRVAEGYPTLDSAIQSELVTSLSEQAEQGKDYADEVITSAISEAAGVVGQVAGLLGTFGVGGSTSGGIAHVPTKSSLQLTLMPVYSRTSARKFSLDRFVTGGYLNNSFGYI